MVYAKRTKGSENRFGQTRWYSLVTRLNKKLVLDHLEIVLILTQDRSMACAERYIGSEIVFDPPDGTPRYLAHLESYFGPFGDAVSVGAR
jgi:hypothetical protein